MVYLGRNGAGDLLDGILWHFFMPGYILFWIFYILTGMMITKVVNVFGNVPIVNAIDCAWIANGNIWMFSGLLFLMKKAALKNVVNAYAILPI